MRMSYLLKVAEDESINFFGAIKEAVKTGFNTYIDTYKKKVKETKDSNTK